MARKKKSSSPWKTSTIPIGNCEVEIEGAAKSFTCESTQNTLQISASKGTKIKVSLVEDAGKESCKDMGHLIPREIGKDEETAAYMDCQYLLINPKDADNYSKSMLQDVLSLYMKELPAMNYAANTGKESMFLERCVSNGKFCTLSLRSKPVEGSGEVIAAVTYQIIPADTQYAEIPLAAVGSIYQHQGIGQLLYMELRKRLQDVGVSTVLCWGDKESEGFWHKQGFVPIAEVDAKGRARRLPIKADVRRALCFPGGSTLMVSHLNKDVCDLKPNIVRLPLKLHKKSVSSSEKFYSLKDNEEGTDTSMSVINGKIAGTDYLQPQVKGCLENDSRRNCLDLVVHEKVDTDMATHLNSATATRISPAKRTVWEASLSSLKSKRIKGSQLADYQSYSYPGLVLNHKGKGDSPCNGNFSDSERVKSLSEANPEDFVKSVCMPQNGCRQAVPTENLVRNESNSVGKHFRIMLMDIADGTKKEHLRKIIEDLGGAVTTDGSSSTHVLTGKVRRTLNFCTALCSGAWILSPTWLKESFKEGRFLDEMPFVLKDDDYQIKFRIDLKEAVLRARRSPQSLLKGYDICLTTDVQPPLGTLSAIARSAGGNVIRNLDEKCERSRTIFVACEEDMDEAWTAVRNGILTFSSEWFVNCIMRQELDLEAPQFAESL